MTTLLERVSGLMRTTPHSRLKVRAGRAFGWAATRLGADPIVEVASPRGTFVVDARSRTDSAMLWNGDYDTDDLDFLIAVTPDDGTFLDIGANVGMVFIPVARALGRDARAIAVEPTPVNHRRLAAAVARNAFAARIRLCELGLGAKSGVLTLVKEGPPGVSGNAIPLLADGGHAESGTDYREVTEVPVRTLDDLVDELALTRLDTVKIDVEGFEVDVLRGSARTLQTLRPLIYGEFNNELMPKRGVSFDDVWNLLRPLGYRAFSFLGPLRLDPKPNPPANLGNAVLIPDEKVALVEQAGIRIER